MRIRTRLTLLFTLITATILLAFAAAVYYSAKETREREFYVLLKKEAITKANLFFNAKVDAQILQNIYRNNRAILNEVEVAIYDKNFSLLYHDAVDIDFVKETRPMIDEIFDRGEMQFIQQDWQVTGLKYAFEGEEYIVTAAAYDHYGISKLKNLLRTILGGSVFSILIIYLAGRFFSRKAFEPVSEMSDKAKNITATNLHLRLNSSGSRDELSELADTFNKMLDRLEGSFDAQKQFVSNISHELRTPLSAIIAEMELTAAKDRSNEEYKRVIESSLADALKLAKLSNSLLDFAKASYDASQIAFRPVRLDEVLLDAQHQVAERDPGYRISIRFENDSLEEMKSIRGNEYLLTIAFANLMENACKFSSDRHCAVSILFGADGATLRFTDKGIGIAPNDLPHIFTPFYRGGNSHYADGNGIGLPLTQRIVLLHSGTVSVTSQPGIGTEFIIDLPYQPL